MKNIYTKLGLSTVENAIYDALLEHGALSISELAEKTGLYRPQIYQHIPQLTEKNLIAESRRGRRKVYVAESPRQLAKIVDGLRSEVEAQLPELLHQYTTTSQQKPMIRYFEGERGIRHIYEDLLATCKKGDIFYRYESPKNYKALRKYIPDEYRVRFRDKMEVERLIITNDLTQRQKMNRLGRLIKVVPPKYDLFMYDITQLIYGTKVAFIDFRTETATLIDSPPFAEFQKKIFKLLFDKL